MDKYWALVQWDGTEIRIPPAYVATVQKRWTEGKPIHTSKGSVNAKAIKEFKPTDIVYGQKLVEGAAQAFKQPLYTENGVQARWVKVDMDDRSFRKVQDIPGYHVLERQGEAVLVAFRLPVHLIAPKHTECTEEEVTLLTKGQ